MKNKEKTPVEFFNSMSNVEYLLEAVAEGEDICGPIFNETELWDWVVLHSNDNDYNYELGRIGWKYIKDNIHELCQLYLTDLQSNDYTANGWSEDEIFSVIDSLTEIINSKL